MRGLLLALLLAGPAAAELRCGWFVNPTPANVWLTDRDGDWLLSRQGGPAAPGFDALPAGSWPAERVEVNGPYGYGCACVEGDFAPPGRVIALRAMMPLPLARCTADPALPAMGAP